MSSAPINVRIVSLCPSLTELVFDLGLGDDLIGRTRFCIHPAPAVDAVERVGGTKNPKVDRIIELAPDIVLMNEEENRRGDAEALEAAGLRVLSSMPRTATDTAEMVREIAEALGAPERGEAIAADIDARAARVERARGNRRVTYAYVIWWEPLMVAGNDTFVAGLLELAGGANVFLSGDRYPETSVPQLKHLAPDVVLMSSEPFPFADKHADELAAKLGWARERFHLVDGELLSWHGSRTPRGIDYAEQVMARAAG